MLSNVFSIPDLRKLDRSLKLLRPSSASEGESFGSAGVDCCDGLMGLILRGSRGKYRSGIGDRVFLVLARHGEGFELRGEFEADDVDLRWGGEWSM